jgi:MinD-like ATPase involved in chromosome partitioning or flagellar assembly
LKVVTFYSFKGGVGRSLSLLNVACQLSRRGQRVGLVDLDIEACGLNHILKIPARDDEDLLSLLVPENREINRLEEAVAEVKFEPKVAPRVFLLPTVADSELLDRVKWDLAAQHFLSKELFPHFGKVYKLDYLLLDARSGLSEFATFALKTADLEVLVCRLDSQNRYGLKRIVEVCDAANKPFLIVASACPEKGRQRALQQFKTDVGCSVNFVLPYEWKLYYQEDILSASQRSHVLSKGYGELAEAIQKRLHENK